MAAKAKGPGIGSTSCAREPNRMNRVPIFTSMSKEPWNLEQPTLAQSNFLMASKATRGKQIRFTLHRRKKCQCCPFSAAPPEGCFSSLFSCGSGCVFSCGLYGSSMWFFLPTAHGPENCHPLSGRAWHSGGTIGSACHFSGRGSWARVHDTSEAPVARVGICLVGWCEIQIENLSLTTQVIM